MSNERTGRCGSSRKPQGESGQSTVEYALIALVVLAIVAGLWALFSKISDGTFVEHASSFASHSATKANSLGFASDVLMY